MDVLVWEPSWRPHRGSGEGSVRSGWEKQWGNLDLNWLLITPQLYNRGCLCICCLRPLLSLLFVCHLRELGCRRRVNYIVSWGQGKYWFLPVSSGKVRWGGSVSRNSEAVDERKRNPLLRSIFYRQLTHLWRISNAAPTNPFGCKHLHRAIEANIFSFSLMAKLGEVDPGFPWLSSSASWRAFVPGDNVNALMHLGQ